MFLHHKKKCKNDAPSINKIYSAQWRDIACHTGTGDTRRLGGDKLVLLETDIGPRSGETRNLGGEIIWKWHNKGH